MCASNLVSIKYQTVLFSDCTGCTGQKASRRDTSEHLSTSGTWNGSLSYVTFAFLGLRYKLFHWSTPVPIKAKYDKFKALNNHKCIQVITGLQGYKGLTTEKACLTAICWYLHCEAEKDAHLQNEKSYLLHRSFVLGFIRNTAKSETTKYRMI